MVMSRETDDDVRGTRSLLAVLCNPPLGSPEETTSWRNVEVLTRVLEAGSFNVVNLIEQPTRSSRDLRELADSLDLDALAWRVSTAATSADLVVVGWGTGAPAGWRKARWSAVVHAAVTGLTQAGHSRVAHVSRVPRHPSRWRQHTSPIHERYAGATFEDRLRAALQWSSPEDLLG